MIYETGLRAAFHRACGLPGAAVVFFFQVVGMTTNFAGQNEDSNVLLEWVNLEGSPLANEAVCSCGCESKKA